MSYAGTRRQSSAAANRDREPAISQRGQRAGQGVAIRRTQGRCRGQPIEIDGIVLSQAALASGLPQGFALIGANHPSKPTRS